MWFKTDRENYPTPFEDTSFEPIIRYLPKLDLKVTIDPSSGFCFGVVYAVELAEDILDEEGRLYCLGDIVHNDEEINRLQKKGLQIITHNDLHFIQDAKVLIRAHGEPPSTYQTALRNNLTLVDASCPVVLKLQNRIKNSHQANREIYIYGKPGHAEVIGLLGQTHGKAVVFQSIKELDIASMPRSIVLYSQTTQSRESFYEVYQQLVQHGIDVELNDTICRQVSNRDAELKRFASRFSTIIFVSGQKSSNGKVLFEACKSANSKSYFVSSTSDLQREWFSQNQEVGICGATSTPMWLMSEIKATLEKF